MPATSDIRLVQHTDIDFIQWDMAMDACTNRLVYGYSTYLNHMSPGWDALVYGDYDAIMPLTRRKKLGMAYLCQPAFTQQLGLFAKDITLLQLLPQFLQTATRHFRFSELMLNYANGGANGVSVLQNYILPLSAGYAEIRRAYRNDLLKNLKRAEKFSMTYLADTDADAAIQLFRAHYGNRLGARPVDYQWFSAMIREMISQGAAFIRKVTLPSGVLLAIGVFALKHGRMYNLASTTLPNGRTLEANHFLFDQLIAEWCEKAEILDFEGSDQPGIARFYQKFGARSQPYFFWKSNRLPIPLRWWKG